MSDIDFLAIPTAQRPLELRRAVDSFSNHLARHGRNEPVIVFHTPKTESDQNAVIDAVRGVGTDTRYVGLAEKIAMAKDIVRAAGVAPALLEFALFQRASQPPATGANRNAILLWGAGRRFVSTDDDTLANLYAHPQYDPQTPLQLGVADGDPSDYFVPEDGNFSSMRVLPGGPREPVGGLLGSFESAWRQCASLGSPPSLVFAGLAGDCGWSAPFGFWGRPLGYLLLNTPSLARLTASSQHWSRVLQSRQLLRAASALRLAHDAPGMSTCFALDAATDLPPFIPLGRGQDLLFSGLVERVQQRPSAWLPFAVAHEPASVRKFHGGELLRAAAGLDLCGVFCALLDGMAAGSGIAAIGRSLQEQASEDDDSFARILVRSHRQLQQRLIEAALSRAAELDLPAYWRDDVERYCERAALQLESTEMPWVLDLDCQDARSSVTAARRLVGQYGELCRAWPAIWAAACARNAAQEDRHPARQMSRASTVAPGPVTEELCPASPYQTWLWRSFLIAPTDPAHLTFRSYRGSGPIDGDLLARCLGALAERHEVLRSRYRGTEAGEALLDILPMGHFAVAHRAPMGPGERGVARELERTNAIDITTQLPLRATLVPMAEQPGGWELWLAFHHIAIDGSSEEIFWRELAAIERNILAGKTALHGLPPLRASFRDIARRQRLQLAATDATAIEAHWQARLDGAPEEFHASYRTPSTPRDSAAVRIRFPVEPYLAAQLRDLARQQRSSLAAIFLSGWQMVLARWSGQPDVVMIIDQSTRIEEADEDSIGLFMLPLPLRANLAGGPRFDALLKRNREAMAESATWRQIPYERLLKALNPGRRRLNLFSSLFTHLIRGAARQLQGMPLEALDLDNEQADYEIGLTVEEYPEAFSLVLIGNRSMFHTGDLNRLAQGVTAALKAMCRDPAGEVGSIDWISEWDRAQLAEWNATQAAFPSDTSLVSLLHDSARQHWDATALEVADASISYGELWRRAAALAAQLRAAGVDRDDRVGLYVDREAGMLVAMLAVLMAGGCYVPLDPAFPRDRLAFMIEDAAPRVLLTTRSRRDSVPASPPETKILCVEDPGLPLQVDPAEWPAALPDSLAYVLYTSGSTGRPKGVEITHRALVNLLWSMAREPGLNSADVLLALTTISGDISGLELWLPLLVGARIVLAGTEQAADGESLAAALARSKATVLQATPSTWRALLATGWQGDPKLKALVGGESLPVDLAQQLACRCAEVWNLYGPTETTIWSTAWRVPRNVEAVRIGRPIANTTMRVLDDERRSLPLGVTGQLYIGGSGVARGYHHRAELTTERFVADPFDPSQRLYATGDLARWLPDGTLEFLGRGDDQIKLRGYRIEPGEIETALLQLPEVAHAAVVMHRPSAGDGRLVAYLVAKPGATLPDSADMRVRLRAWLLDPMLPYHFVHVDQLPLTPNGKTDRRQLASRHLESGNDPAAASETASVLEAELMIQFSQMLDRPVALDTDFFEAGGDSLGALRLIAQLARKRVQELTTGELFLHSTPRRLAARVQQLESERPSFKHLIQMREGSGQMAVLFVHPIGGHLTPYARLALSIGADTPLYGLQAAVAGGASYESIEERCAAYVEEILQKWSGPVTLCGYSLGGVLAMEIAAQLRAVGREVATVTLLDASVPRPLAQGIAKIRFRVQELRRFSWSDRRIWLLDQLSRLLLGGQSGEQDAADSRPLIDAEEMIKLSQQALRWRPPTYPGKVLLFAAERHVRGYSRKPGHLGWEQVCSDLEVVNLPCDHREAVYEPYVARIAAAMEAVVAAGASARS